jgi:RNA polymerase sigma-70 factor (ECF subfamily)
MREEPSPGGQPEADDGLAVRARTDRAAFGQLYDRFYPRIARYCLRRLFDRTIAEDVTSEVFLSVVTNFRSFPGWTETDFCRWLFRIATNAVNSHLRQFRRRKELWKAAALGRRWEQEGSGTSSAGQELSDWPAVYQAVLELDERDQTILMLRFFGDCSHEEIAGVVDATPGAVRTALSRSLSRLRERFNPARPAEPAGRNGTV